MKIFRKKLQAMALRRGLTPSMGKRRHHCFRSGEEGGALVEFALVLPLMLMILTGTFSVVMSVVSYQQLQNAVDSAATQVGPGRGMLAGGDPCATVATTVTTLLPNWDATKFTYTVSITDSSGTAHSFGPTTGSSFSCTAGFTDMSQNSPANIVVSYAYTPIPMFLMKLAGNLSVSANVLVD